MAAVIYLSEYSKSRVGALLGAKRQRSGINQYDMAKKMGLSVSQVAAIESDDPRGFHGGLELFNRTVTLYARKLSVSLGADNAGADKSCGLKVRPEQDATMPQIAALLRQRETTRHEGNASQSRES